jgi:endonuclease/exonuclease/phosphatase family metal-dependent hydrolase
MIRAETPDVVALNEICEDDIVSLARGLDELAADDVVVTAFGAVGDPRSGTDYRCGRNGERYGIGILARLPGRDAAHSTRSGTYPAQDRTDPELRVWVCLDAEELFLACTTHLVNTVPAIALTQCQHLMATAFGDEVGDATAATSVPAVTRPTVVAGDLNLRVGGPADLRSCLPAGVSRIDNGGALHVVTDVAIASDASLDMAGTSDHPALLAVLGR